MQKTPPTFRKVGGACLEIDQEIRNFSRWPMALRLAISGSAPALSAHTYSPFAIAFSEIVEPFGAPPLPPPPSGDGVPYSSSS